MPRRPASPLRAVPLLAPPKRSLRLRMSGRSVTPESVRRAMFEADRPPAGPSVVSRIASAQGLSPLSPDVPETLREVVEIGCRRRPRAVFDIRHDRLRPRADPHAPLEP